MQFTTRNLTNQYISLSYQDVVQNYVPTGSTTYLLDGLGNVLFSVASASLGQQIATTDQIGTASLAVSSSYAVTASLAYQAISASYARTASYAANVPETASYSLQALSASYAPNAIFSETASYLIEGANIYLSQSYIFANTNSVAPSHIPGQMWYDSARHTYAIDMDKSDVRLQIGQENYIRVEAGEPIPNGAAVYIDGINVLTTIPIAYLAIADGTNTKSSVVGLATQTLTTGEEGFVTTAGVVNDVNTAAFGGGDLLFLSDTTPGTWTVTVPLYPAEKVVIGTVLNANNTFGRILVALSTAPYREIYSVGAIEPPSLSATGSIVNVGGTRVNLCTTADGKGLIKAFDIPSASFSVTSSFLDVQYLVADYNGGVPVYDLITNIATVDEIQKTTLASFTMGATGISYVDWDASGLLLSNKQLHRIIDLWGAQRSRGLELTTSASHILIDAGEAWLGVKNLTFTTASTANAGQFVLIAHSASIWSGSLLNGWINDRYDNGANLQPTDPNKYVNNYVWRGIGSKNRAQVTLGQQYTQYADAVAEVMPAPPAELPNIAILCGRIVTKQGQSTASLVESAFTTIFSVAGVTTHNLLNGLEGGSGSIEYYHLGLNEYMGTGTGVIVRQSGSLITGSISNAVSASYALNVPDTASYANTASYAVSASEATIAVSASYFIPGLPLHLSNSYIQSAVSMSAPAWKEGRLFWDKVNHTYAIYNDRSDVTLQIGQENFIHVIAGENINNGEAVYIDGPIQDPKNPTNWMPTIYKALADVSVQPLIDRVVGLATHNFVSGSSGWITNQGVIHDIDTSAWTGGDILYLSSTTYGGYQNFDPGQPYSNVEIGTVIRSDVVGSILVVINKNPPPSNAYAGMITVPTITSDGSGSITVSTGSVNLYANSSGIGAVTTYPLKETIFPLIIGSTNYITARVSSSMTIGEYFLTTNSSYANSINIVRVATLDIYNADTASWDVHQFDIGIVGLALANRTNNKDILLYGYQRENGLTLFTTGSSGSFGITEGIVWYGPNSHVVPTFDTTVIDNYTYIFHTSGSDWHRHTSSVFIAGYYDNGAGSSSLTPCAPSSWSVNFVYRLIGTSDESAIVMSSQQFATELDATNNATTPSNLPSTIRDIGLLVGRFVVQSGSISTPTIESAFTNTFIPAVVTEHESLLGLQGSTIGAGGGHYHMTQEDYAGSGTGMMLRQTNATMSNPMFTAATPGHIPYWNSNQQLTLTGSVQVISGQYVTINSASVDGTNPEALLVEQVNPTSVSTIGAYAEVDNFSQIYNQNFSSGTLASTDICATADIGNQDTHFIDMGIASSQYAHPSWPFEKPLDGYLYIHGGDLWLGTLTTHSINFVFDNTASTNYADKTGFYLSGSLHGTSSFAVNALSVSIITSASYVATASYVGAATFITLAETASYVVTSETASYVLVATSASYVSTASYVGAATFITLAQTASYVPLTQTASYVGVAISASYVSTASYVGAATFITCVGCVWFLLASNVDGTVTSASFATTASYVFPPSSASWASSSISASHANNADNAYAISFVPTNATSASYASSSISSSRAITASFALGIPTIKAGLVSGSTFTGNPKLAQVAFAASFVNNLYSVTVTGEASRTWTIQQKSESGFIINSNNNTTPTGMVFWQAIYRGEYYS